MKIVVHYPKSPDDIKKLTEKVADIHAAAIEAKIKNLPCPKEQKAEIIEQTMQMLQHSGQHR